MYLKSPRTRRDFIMAGTATGSGLLLAGLQKVVLGEEKSADQSPAEKPKTVEDVSPTEDLMREHGLFDRILLIYEDSVQQLNVKKAFNQKSLADVAQLVRTFIEDYHSKLEEDRVFPCFEKAGKLVELVAVLRRQHQVGRLFTDQVLQLTATDKRLDESSSKKLAVTLSRFIHMYRPHVAREDTVLFPAMHSIITPNDYEAMGDQFEDRERELFGDNGFEKMVDRIAGIEKILNIYDLSQFTPLMQ